jgi:hypothetical protein
MPFGFSTVKAEFLTVVGISVIYCKLDKNIVLEIKIFKNKILRLKLANFQDKKKCQHL